MDLRYHDIATEHIPAIPVLQLGEILANKWLMLDSRQEPRDLFDLWWALEHEAVPFQAIVAAHQVAYRHPPMPASIERAARLKSRWEQRLTHQLRDLAPFEAVIEAVRHHFEAWRSSAT